MAHASRGWFSAHAIPARCGMFASFLLVFGTLAPSPAWPGEPGSPRLVAVLEFRGSSGFPPDFLRKITDEVRGGTLDALAGQPYSVLSRENMEVVLKDMGLDSRCMEGDCEVETARNLNADLVVSGEALQVEETFLITLKIHETRKGTLLRTEEVRGARLMELIDLTRPRTAALLRSALGQAGSAASEPVARAAEGRIQGSTTPLALPAGVEEVVVRFESEPAGAVVRVDDRLLCQATPCSRALPVGPHIAAVDMERHHGVVQGFEAVRGAVVRLKLKPRYGWLAISTTPPGLAVRINGDRVVPGAATDRAVDPGVYEVVVDEGCFIDEGERVVISEGARRHVQLSPRARTAGLRVEVDDLAGNALEGVCRVDGKEVGYSPGTFEVPVCSRGVEIVLPGGMRVSRPLALAEGQVAAVRIAVGVPPPAGEGGRSGGGSSRTTAEYSPRTARLPPDIAHKPIAKVREDTRQALVAEVVDQGPVRVYCVYRTKAKSKVPQPWMDLELHQDGSSATWKAMFWFNQFYKAGIDYYIEVRDVASGAVLGSSGSRTEPYRVAVE